VHFGDGVRVVAEFGKHVIGVFTKQRGCGDLGGSEMGFSNQKKLRSSRTRPTANASGTVYAHTGSIMRSICGNSCRIACTSSMSRLASRNG
jgi:hypothetical protein